MLTQQGYKLAVDWSLECVHMTEQGDLLCKDYGLLSRKVKGFSPVVFENPNVEPLTAFPAKGPRLKRISSNEKRTIAMYKERYSIPKRHQPKPSKLLRVSFAEAVEFFGVTYPAGVNIIDRSIAVEMSHAGIIKAKL
jgi:hypothetical protein